MITEEYNKFNNDEEIISFLQESGILSKKETELKPFYYKGMYSPQPSPVRILGYEDTPFSFKLLVIDFGTGPRSISPKYLQEMQSDDFALPGPTQSKEVPIGPLRTNGFPTEIIIKE